MLAFHRAGAWDKIQMIEKDFELLREGIRFPVPEIPARDIKILPPQQHPAKAGLSTLEGQARLLHDLASIEMQAMELGLRTLNEFPQADPRFREELIEITRSEAFHLRLCLEALEDLRRPWGSWPVHCYLWMATSAEDSLLDRVLIVHRYLEGSGLDAGEQILKRLQAVAAPHLKEIIQQITSDEISHVDFGSRWYRDLCKAEDLNPEVDFANRLRRIKKYLPRRIEKISHSLRKKAGFTEKELQICEDFRAEWMAEKN